MHITPASGNDSHARRTGKRCSPTGGAESRQTEWLVSRSMKTRLIVEYDATQLIAALEDVEARRLAIEALLEAGLLAMCLA